MREKRAQKDTDNAHKLSDLSVDFAASFLKKKRKKKGKI